MGESGLGSGQLVRVLPPRRRQRLRTAGLTRRIQRLDSRTVALFVRMIVTLGHRHRLVASEVVDSLGGASSLKRPTIKRRAPLPAYTSSHRMPK